MKKGNYLFLILSVLVFVCHSGISYAAGEEKVSQEIPAWLDRVDVGIDAGTDIDPRVYFETIQPLYQEVDKSRTIFIQPRYSFEKKDSVFNLGLGYRRLLNQNSILWGINSFFDYEDKHQHYRCGFGAEAFINQVEFRGNTYIGLSPRRKTRETPTGREYEKAVDGFDAEIGIPLPHLNWIKVFGAGYFYNYEKFKNKEGWRLRNEIKPGKFTTINFIAWDDNKGDPEFRVDARVTIPLEPTSGKEYAFSNVGFSTEAYPEKADHSDRTLDRVEREYRIEVERWVETVGATVEIKRGN